MRKIIRSLIVVLMVSIFSFQYMGDGKVYAHDVKFYGITAPNGVNVRGGTSLNSQLLYTITGDTRVNFAGWEEGDSVRDYWNGSPDNKWFFFFDRNNQKVYVASAGINGNPPTNQVPLSSATVPEIRQEMSNWCWAATSSAILQHYGLNTSQQEIVQYVKGGLINQPGYDYEILNGIQHFGLNGNIGRNIPSYPQIQNQINKGNPLETMISWSSGGGHALVLDGYFNNNGRNYVKIMDPWYGDHFDYEYNYYRNNSSFQWQAYIGNFSRR